MTWPARAATYGVLSLLTIASSCLAPLGAAELRVASCTRDSAGLYHSTVSLAAAGQSVAALQFDLEYNPAQVHLKGTLNSVQQASKGLSQIAVISPSVQRVLIAGLNSKSLADGKLLDLQIEVTAADAGCAGTVQLTKASAAGPGGESVPLSVVPESGAPMTVRLARPGRIGQPKPPAPRR
jgi:hypothetical protein